MFISLLKKACRLILCIGMFCCIGKAYDVYASDINALDISPSTNSSYQIAGLQFLPDFKDSEIGVNDNELNFDYNLSPCKAYTLSSCPTKGNCSACPFDTSKFKLDSCSSPYVISGNSCDCPPYVTVGANEKCIATCLPLASNNPSFGQQTKSAPAMMSTTTTGSLVNGGIIGGGIIGGNTGSNILNQYCIKKECVPTPDSTNCTNGFITVDDGCGGTRKGCAICLIRQPPQLPVNAEYTYTTCIDDDGTHTNPTGWKCKPGYNQTTTGCTKCITNNCSGYPYTSCPYGANCSSCTITATDCSTDGTKYKITSCKTGLSPVMDVSGNITSCRCTKSACELSGSYPLTSCPEHGKCASCSITLSLNTCSKQTKYAFMGCEDGYMYQAGKCVPGCPSGQADTSTYWCTAPKTTDCATLGYKRASGSCGSLTQIACPFDKSKVACIDFN